MRGDRLGGLALLALVACGDDGPRFLDAGPSDGPVVELDAPVAGNVTLTVVSRGAPLAGVDVVWTDPTGAVIAHEATNNVGVATERVLPGSAVTVAAMGGGNTFTGTYLAIEPGDELTWQFEPPALVRHSDLWVSLPGVQANATRYRIQLGCGTPLETETPLVEVTVTVATACLGTDQNIDVVATALAASGAVVGYSVRTDVAVVANGVIGVIMGPWQTALSPLTVTLTNPPIDLGGIGFEGHFRADGLDFRGIDASGGGPAPITLTSGYFQGGVVERTQYALFIGRGTPQTPAGASVLLGGVAGAPAAISHDLSTLLPTITAVTASNAAGRLQVGWTSAGSFASTDGALLITSWMEGTTSHQAFVMAPPGAATPIVAPPLPDALAAFRPTAASVFNTPTVIFIDGDFLSSYRAFRPVGWRLFGNGAVDILPASGGLVRATLGGQLPGM